MSDVQTSARDVKAAAAQWFERRNFWPRTGETEAEFATWLNASLAHRAAYVRIEAAWKRTERLTVLKSAVRPQPQSAAVPRRMPRPWFFGAVAAAAAFVAVLGANAMFSAEKPETQTYATAIGGRETLALADGSKIELNTDTQLRTQITARERRVWLDRGEAYFQVKHDAGPSLRRDRRQSPRHRSGHQILHSPRSRQNGSGAGGGQGAGRCPQQSRARAIG